MTTEERLAELERWAGLAEKTIADARERLARLEEADSARPDPREVGREVAQGFIAEVRRIGRVRGD
ncbi:MAG: hypothetical protein LBQ06_01210 [Frankiaceae bacterium]|jgi:hypothetical protein|nr:hypothetical protein [Frankiaceae bacterium]